MRKRRKITTMDTQERYFQNSLGHPSLPTALFFLADPRALIRSISRGIACCSAAFFMPAKKGPVCGRLTSSFLAEAFRPTPVSRERSTAVSPAGPRSEGSSRKRSTAVSPFNPRAKGLPRKRSTAVPATEPGSTSQDTPASAAMATPPPRAHRLPSRSMVGSRDFSSSGRDSSLSQDSRSKQLPQKDMNPNGYGR